MTRPDAPPLDHTALIAALACALPPDAILADPAARRAHAIDGLIPPLVVRPPDVAGVSATLRAAREADAAVVPWGGGTQQALGHPPRRVDLVLSLARLDRVLIYEPGDLTLSAEAGCTAAQIGNLLAAHNQHLPLDPPRPDRATLGGIVATATAGPRRAAHGWVRDLLIGITFVGPDGTVAKGGGMTVKNVAGYDLMKLHLGALGTVGVIVAVNLKVLPRPATSGGLAAGFPDLDGALAVADRLVASQLLPSAVNLLGQFSPSEPGAPRNIGLSVIIEGTAPVVAHQLDLLAAWTRDAGGQANVLPADAALQSLHQAADFPQTAALAPDEAVIRLTVPPADLRAALTHAATAVAAHGLRAAWLCHAPAGALLLRLSGVARDDGAPLRVLHDDLVARWRSVVILGCSPALKPGLAIWGAAPDGLPLMRALKDRFDPAHLLNPGRYVGGI